MRDFSQNLTNVSYKRGWTGVGGIYAGQSSYNTVRGNLLRKKQARSNIIKSNGITPTPYNAYRLSVAGGSFNAKSGVLGNAGTGTWINEIFGTMGMSNADLAAIGIGPSPLHLPGVDYSVKAEARTKVLNKLQESKVDLGESLGSIRSTAAMVFNTLTNLLRAFKWLLRGNLKNAAKALGIRSNKYNKARNRSLKGLASDWLALQFGWLPLMNDIANGVDQINKSMNQRPPLLTVKSTKVRGKSPGILSGYYYYLDGGIEKEGSKNSSLIQGCQVGLTYQVSDETIAGLSELNVLNPLHVAWQLLPLSFVYDWFVSVGNVLSALSADWGLTFLAGYETTFVRGSGTLVYTGWERQYPLGTHPRWSINAFSMERSVLTDSPKPGLYIPSGLNFNGAQPALKQLATMLSLIAQRG